MTVEEETKSQSFMLITFYYKCSLSCYSQTAIVRTISLSLKIHCSILCNPLIANYYQDLHSLVSFFLTLSSLIECPTIPAIGHAQILSLLGFPLQFSSFNRSHSYITTFLSLHIACAVIIFVISVLILILRITLVIIGSRKYSSFRAFIK